jgi:hypothetical protein
MPHQHRVFAQRRREFRHASRRMAGEDEICARRQNDEAEPDIRASLDARVRAATMSVRPFDAYSLTLAAASYLSYASE